MCHTCVRRLSAIWELLFRTKKMINSGFFYGKKSMSPLTADDVFKNSTPKSFCQKKMFTVFLSKKVFSMNLFFVSTPQMTFVWRSLVKTSTILVRWGPPNVWALTLENPGTYLHSGVKYILKSHLNSWLPQILRDIFDQRNKTVSLRSPLVFKRIPKLVSQKLMKWCSNAILKLFWALWDIQVS